MAVIVSSDPTIWLPAKACRMAVVAVVVAALLTSTVLSLSVTLAPSSARAALALPAPISSEVPLASIALPLPVASRPWLRLRDFSPSTGEPDETAAPLVCTVVPPLRLMVAPLRAQAPTEPFPVVVIEPPSMSTLPLSASTPWPLPPAVEMLESLSSTLAPLSAFTPYAEAPVVVTLMSLPVSELLAPVTRRAWLPAVAVLRAPLVEMLAPLPSVALPPFSTDTPTAPHDPVVTEPPLMSKLEPAPVTTTPRLLLPFAPPPIRTSVPVRETEPPESIITPVRSLVVITTLAAVLGSRVTLLPVVLMCPPSLACRPVCALAFAAVTALLLMLPVFSWMLLPAPARTPVVSAAFSLMTWLE
ncbi:hypothetical protein D3C76_441860 [compost metagenome]